MLPSAPSSTFTVTSSIPLWCGNLICNTVRILVLPSGSVSLLMLLTDFDLQIVENDCFKNSVPEAPWRSLVCCPWRSALSPWRLPEWSWKEADSILCALLVPWLLLDLDCWRLFLFLRPLDVLRDHLSPPPDCLDLHWVLKWFLFPLMTFFTKCWALSRWVRGTTLTTCLTLTPGTGSGSRSLAFSCEGSDLIDGGRRRNSAIGLVSVKVFDSCFVLFCVLQ